MEDIEADPPAEEIVEGEKPKRKRIQRIYPAWTYEQSLPLAQAIQQYASGERVSRLTLFKALDKSPTSSVSQNLITNSTKYGLTLGSFAAEYLELTSEGKFVTDPSTPKSGAIATSFILSISNIKPFNTLYERFKGKKVPAHEVLADTLREAHTDIGDTKECIDIFIVNCRYLGIVQTLGGSETLIPIEAHVTELKRYESSASKSDGSASTVSPISSSENGLLQPKASKKKWDNICFYIAPIGQEASDERKHSDLFLNHLVEPALKNLGFDVVRADKIGEAGLITAQILEHILSARLVIVDLSFHNPNVFYEMAIRHASKMPIVQISRKRDSLPFDVNQIRTVIIDDSDIYTLIPNMESYRSEIATQVRGALEGQNQSNPISVFFPKMEIKLSE